MFVLELQEPTDLSILLEWQGFAVDGFRDGHLDLGFDTALQAVDLAAVSDSDLDRLVLPRESIERAGLVSTMPVAADAYFRAHRFDSSDGPVSVEAGFAIVLVLSGTGILSSPGGSLEVTQGRRRARALRLRRLHAACGRASGSARRGRVPATGPGRTCRRALMPDSARPEPIDWDLAVATARRLAPKGPDLPPDETRAAVAMLRDLARAAVEPVRGVTGLVAPDDSPAVVVDRSGWIASNVSGMRVVLNSWEDFAEKTEAAPAVVRSLGSRGTALQLGAVLAWMSGKVLGQFETFTDPGEPRRLLLVAPTIVHVEQQLEVPERDFRFWVCLHEETHRVQFGAVPWLADHLSDRLAALLEASDLGARESLQRLVAFGYALIRSMRSDSDVSIVETIQTPEQKVIFDELTALMSLLEGHADVVMDDVGPVGDPVGGADPRALQRAPPAAGRARQLRSQGARDGRQDAAVQRRRGLRPPCRRPRGDGRLQPGVDVARLAAVPRGDPRAGRCGSTGCPARHEPSGGVRRRDGDADRGDRVRRGPRSPGPA